MPRRKEPCPPEYLRELISDHQIRFSGPIPQKNWPAEHTIHFETIRGISRLWYDEFENGGDLDSLSVIKTKMRIKKRVENLRRRADHCRHIRANEDTWKDYVLPIVTARFSAEVVCKNCRNEIWISEYQASPANEAEAARLRRKRAKRKLCQCSPETRDSQDREDDGGLSIFDTRCGNEVLHDPQDQLENFSIPMRPDRVVGLATTKSFREATTLCPRNIRHSPIKDAQILYPFLVIEAKPEKDVPGFESIEAQTAFPIRRLLKLQENLRITRGVELDPFVWFFAFQGEEWRLYAGTLRASTVNVIDIWHGTILSRDGALQLLCIMDYICDWARNIYRPKIRECIAGDIRQLSPTTTCPFRRSQSVHTTATELTPAMPQYEFTMDDETLLPGDGKTFRFLNEPEASFHPFFRWSNDSLLLDNWTVHATIRHSDLVNCSIRVLDIPEDAADLSNLVSSVQQDEDGFLMISLLARLTQSSRYVLYLTRRKLDHLKSCWTGAAMNPTHSANAKDPGQSVGTFIFFRTFCDPEDWQINREMCCITWSLEAARLVGTTTGQDGISAFDRRPWFSPTQSEISEIFAPFHSLCGRSSVAYALWNVIFILSVEIEPTGSFLPEWELPSAQGISEAMIAQLQNLTNGAATRQAGVSLTSQCSGLLEVFRNEMPTEILSSLPLLPDDMGKRGAMLALKPDFWPPTCPRFCLFVLAESCFDQQQEFGHFLLAVAKDREMYGVGDPNTAGTSSFLSRDDRLLIRRWIGSLGVVQPLSRV